ncbi:MAG: hypothetical protein RLZZ519_394 [Bacteroidota bacterium]
MRKQIVLRIGLMLMVLTPLVAKTQLFVGIGLQAGFDNMPNANIPIDRFNSRAFRYKQMNRFHWPFGEIYEASIRSGRGLVSLNLNTRRQRATAKSTSTNGIDQLDVRFTMQALSLGAGYAAIDKETFVWYLGGAVDAGYMRLLTRSGPSNQIARVPYYLYRRLPMLAITLNTKFVFRGSRESIGVWSLTPYLHIPLRDFDFLPLDQLLNGGGSMPILTTPLPARPINVGVAFNMDIDLLRFLDN